MDDPPLCAALRVETIADDRVSVGGYGGRRSQRPPGKRGAQTIRCQYLLEILDARGLIPNECSVARISASASISCWTHKTDDCRSVR